MPTFPSSEWMDAYCDELAAHHDAVRAAQALDGVYRFVVEPDGPLQQRCAFDVLITPDGDGAEVRQLDGGSEPRMTMTARYGRWRQLIQGQLDIGMAIVLRRLRISGDVATLRSRLSDAKPLTESLQRVDTQWLG
jgi:hypothetical protein